MRLLHSIEVSISVRNHSNASLCPQGQEATAMHLCPEGHAMHKAPPAHKHTVGAVKRVRSALSKPALFVFFLQCMVSLCNCSGVGGPSQHYNGQSSCPPGQDLSAQNHMSKVCRLQKAAWLAQELIQVLNESCHALIQGAAQGCTQSTLKEDTCLMNDFHALCRKLKLAKMGVTNGVLRGMSGLTSLDELLLPNSHRVTDVGLGFFSGLTNLRCCTPLHCMSLLAPPGQPCIILGVSLN